MKFLSVLFVFSLFFLCSLYGNAQHSLFTYYGQVEPQQISFQEDVDEALFQQYLSSSGYPWDKKNCSFTVGVCDEREIDEVDSIYWRFVFLTPGFKVFRSFRLECENGYLVGVYNTYHGQNVHICNLDLISYDVLGKIIQRTSFPIFQSGFFFATDTCPVAYQKKGGLLYIENGFAVFNYESVRLCTPEMTKGSLHEDLHLDETRSEKKRYVYKIKDDARLTLFQTSDIEISH